MLLGALDFFYTYDIMLLSGKRGIEEMATKAQAKAGSRRLAQYQRGQRRPADAPGCSAMIRDGILFVGKTPQEAANKTRAQAD